MTIANINPKAHPQVHSVRRYLRDSYGGLYIVDDERRCWELWNGGKGGWPVSIHLRSVGALSESPYNAPEGA